MAPIHFFGNAENLGLLPIRHIFKKMVGVAVLSGIVGRIYVNQIRMDSFHQLIGILLKTLIVWIVMYFCHGDRKLQRFIELRALAVSIIVAAGNRDFIHGIEKGGDEQSTFSVV